ncbi:MAG: methionine--tRNA ligase [Proteobacteria bacterium]|nr:methionine--tRNA ligase [Pseudomonadota bacterium]NIS71077.1 methionine--tRNA ligase [Pseudomonadota bacterium]
MDRAPRFYVTTPIYYVNAPPHLGHAYTTIVADVLSRFYRLAGYETFFLTGTDEHGDKVVQAAADRGLAPKAYADEISNLFRALWPRLNISNDHFIRTTDSDHKGVVQRILQIVHGKGDIYFGEYAGYYCIGCERFVTESELEDGKCPDHQKEPEFRKEKNYFFAMSKYQQWLIEHIRENPEFIRPERYRNKVLSALETPLDDLCISRPKERLSWGIPLPFDSSYVTYVWFDALINYISGIGYPSDFRFPKFWPEANHLIAKDILIPHGIYWPIMLKASGIEPYAHLNVHGYWNIQGGKMSKSKGEIVRPLDLEKKYGLDAFRYFLMREMVFGLDSTFSESALVSRLNSDLANDLGNLIRRSLAMVMKYFNGVVPPPAALENADEVLKEKALESVRSFESEMRSLGFHKALISTWDFIGHVNKYIDETAPWKLAKDSGQHHRLSAVLYNTLECLRVISCLLVPFMPQTGEKIWTQLGMEGNIHDQGLEDTKAWGRIRPGQTVLQGAPLFPRRDLTEGDVQTN